MGQPVFVLRDLQPAFGGAFLALFGHDADRMGAMAKGDLLHFLSSGHLEVQRNGQDIHQPFDIGVGDVPTVFAQVRRNAIRACLFRDLRRPQGIRVVPAPRVSDGGDMVNVHPEPQLVLFFHLRSPAVAAFHV